jgi:UDP-glucuronate decarboxylase
MAVGDGRVVSNFIVQALQGNPITIYGDGSQTRSFCYVTDLVDGILKMLTLDANPNSPINLGNPIEYSMLELANKIIGMTNSKSSVVFEPLPLDDPRQRRPDIAMANSVLKWSPRVSLDSGIEMTAKYFALELGV